MTRSRQKSLPSLGATLALALCVAGPAAAYNVYKNVDAAGNVTYSTHPPPDAQTVEQVKLKPGPTAEQQTQAWQREQKIINAAEEIQQQNEAAAAEQAASVQTAQSKVSIAEESLEQASEYRDDDWQGTVSGYRKLKESYFERVARARIELEQAQAELKAAKQRKSE